MAGKTCDSCKTKFKPDDLCYQIETNIEDEYKHSRGLLLHSYYLCENCIEPTQLKPLLNEINQKKVKTSTK